MCSAMLPVENAAVLCGSSPIGFSSWPMVSTPPRFGVGPSPSAAIDGMPCAVSEGSETIPVEPRNCLRVKSAFMSLSTSRSISPQS